MCVRLQVDLLRLESLGCGLLESEAAESVWSWGRCRYESCGIRVALQWRIEFPWSSTDVPILSGDKISIM